MAYAQFQGMETPSKPYSLKWFLEEIVRAIVVVVIGLLAIIVGTGLIESYLLPERLKKNEEQMMKKFEDRLRQIQQESVERESEFAKIIADLKRHAPPKFPELPPGITPVPGPGPEPEPNEDPEKVRLKYLEKHLWNNQVQQQQQQRMR